MTVEWTNTAQHPSKLKERSIEELKGFFKDVMNLPGCMTGQAAHFVKQQKGVTTVTSSTSTWNKYTDYHTTMMMSFSKKGQDYKQLIKPAPGVMAIGKTQAFSCGGKVVHITYWPKCGNVSILVPKFDKNKWDEFCSDDPRDGLPPCEPTHTVPSPSTSLLIVLGLGVAYLLLKWRMR